MAVDPKELKEGAEFADMKVRDVPHQVPSGYGGFSGQVRQRGCAMAAPQMAMCAAPPGGGMRMMRGAPISDLMDCNEDLTYSSVCM